MRLDVRRWGRRTLAVGALGGVAFALAQVLAGDLPSTTADAAGGATADRVVVIPTNRTRRLVLPACDRPSSPERGPVGVGSGDTSLTFRRGTGRRVVRVHVCPVVARVVLTRAAAEVLPVGAPTPETVPPDGVQAVVIPRASDAGTVVVPRCAPGEVASARRIVLDGRTSAGRTAVAPGCGLP